jgi:hypothetical protein
MHGIFLADVVVFLSGALRLVGPRGGVTARFGPIIAAIADSKPHASGSRNGASRGRKT